MEIKLSLNKNINENANIYFEKAKKLKAKLPGILEAIENTKKEIKEFEEKKENYVKKKEQNKLLEQNRKKEWFEKFRWTKTNSGFLCVMGKDAGTNEVLIKKHLEQNDIIIHTEAPASPFGIIKNALKDGKTLLISKEEIEETASIIACFSAQWKKGYGTADAFWIYPNQISKEANSGEYIAKGAFMIRGEKNQLKNLQLKICLGIENKKIETEDKQNLEYNELFSGSENACKKYCGNRYLKLEPGLDNYKKMTKEIKTRLKVSNLEDLPKYIPNDCKILKR